LASSFLLKSKFIMAIIIVQIYGNEFKGVFKVGKSFVCSVSN
jgi:hypothetical protein